MSRAPDYPHVRASVSPQVKISSTDSLLAEQVYWESSTEQASCYEELPILLSLEEVCADDSKLELKHETKYSPLMSKKKHDGFYCSSSASRTSSSKRTVDSKISQFLEYLDDDDPAQFSETRQYRKSRPLSPKQQKKVEILGRLRTIPLDTEKDGISSRELPFQARKSHLVSYSVHGRSATNNKTANVGFEDRAAIAHGFSDNESLTSSNEDDLFCLFELCASKVDVSFH